MHGVFGLQIWRGWNGVGVHTALAWHFRFLLFLYGFHLFFLADVYDIFAYLVAFFFGGFLVCVLRMHSSSV